MDDKKIYEFLQDWFPELKQRKIPKKKYRRDYREFSYWMGPIAKGETYRGYLQSIDRQQHFDNGVESCALFQDRNVNAEEMQQRIETRTAPLFEHYEKYQELIGRFYELHSHVYDVVLEEIYNEVRKQEYRMLLIYEMDIVWVAVPDQPEKIKKFLRLFQRQFKDSCPRTEVYERFDLASSGWLSDD